MTLDYDKLRALCEKATPGEWLFERHIGPGGAVVGGNPETPQRVGDVHRLADAAFIAYAREAVPELLAENERLRARLALVEPVVAAAVEWSESFGELSKRLPPHVHKLRDAVDALDAALSTTQKAGGDE